MWALSPCATPWSRSGGARDGMGAAGERSRRRWGDVRNGEGFLKWLLREVSGQELEVQRDPWVPWMGNGSIWKCRTHLGRC